jgi:hypothetical protein
VIEPAIVDIAEDDVLLRRFFRNLIKEDGSLSSTVYMTRSKKPDPSCSVYLERLTTAALALAADPRGPSVVGIARLPASKPMSLGLGVAHAPLSTKPGSAEYAHSEIRGLTTKAQCAELAECSIIVLDAELADS